MSGHSEVKEKSGSFLAQRAATLVVAQRIEDGRDVGSAGSMLPKPAAVLPVDGGGAATLGAAPSAPTANTMTVTDGMDIKCENHQFVDVAFNVIGGNLKGIVRTNQSIRVEAGRVEGFIETNGDLIVSGGEVSGTIIAKRILVKENGHVSGVCISNTIAATDKGSIIAEMRSQTAADDDWRREVMLREIGH